MSRRGIHPLLMGLEKTARKVENKETELTGYESAQHRRFLRAETEEAEANEPG